MSNPLLAYRRKNAMSQKQLAEKIGCSRGMIGHWEQGKRKITAEMAVAIERSLGIARVITRPDLFRRA